MTFLWAEGEWFVEVGYVEMFWIRLAIQGLTGIIVVVTSLGFLGINGAIAHRNAQSAPLLEGDRSQAVDNIGIQKLAFSKNSLPLLGVGIFVVLSLLTELILPPVFQRAVVQPNELRLEQPYIQHAIASTRQAFGLSDIEVETFDPDNELTIADLNKNSQTVENIRLWDTRPLLATNRQLQRIRLYYEFPDADIDRYSLPTANGSIASQQVLIAARELDYSAVPAAAQTWVNKHSIYTHGYGFTLSPVNTAREGDLPNYLVQGIEPVTIDPRI